MINLNDKILDADNFTYGEFIRSSIANRFNINNYPDNDQIWKNIESLAINCLQPIRNQFGPIRILSGFRCPALNKAVGGSKTSNHLNASSCDFEPINTNIKLIEIIDWIHDNLKWKELIAEYFDRDGWVHIAFKDDNFTDKIKLKDKNHNYSIVDIKYLDKLYQIK